MTPARDYLAPIGHGDCAPLIKIIEKVRADVLEEAARVCEAETEANARAREDRADDELAFEFRGLGEVIATIIRNLGDKA